MRHGLISAITSLTVFLALGAVVETAWAADPPPVDAQPPGATTPIPDGYLRVQAPPEWRGQTPDWYLVQAKSMYADYVAEGNSTFAGVAIVDRDAGDILAQFDANALASP